MKKAALPLLLLCLLVGCSAAADLTHTRKLADEFMAKLAKGDTRGAYEMCDQNALNYDGLQELASNPEYAPIFDNYNGLDHGEGGKYEEKEGTEEVRLTPATPEGHENFQLLFAFRKVEDDWKIIGFKIEKK